MAATPSPTADAAVGWRVQVFWEGESEWFSGTIIKYTPADGYYVRYDDGEEQWEDADGETQIEFVSPPLTTEQDQQVASQRHSAGTDGAADVDDDYADDDDDDFDNDDEVNRASSGADSKANGVAMASQKSPTPELDDDDDDDDHINNDSETDRDATTRQQRRVDAAASSSPLNHGRPQQQLQQQQQARRTALHASSAAVFYRDNETLREMREALVLEKQTLTHALATLTRQLDDKQHRSAQLKRELDELKTSVTLANVLNHHSASAGNSEPAPRTAADWRERVLDRKLQNKQSRQELVELRASVQQRAHVIEQRERQCAQLREKLARVPRRDICSLVDVQVEIAAVLDEKRVLAQAVAAATAAAAAKRTDAAADTGPSDGTFGWPNDGDAAKVALEKTLSKLELACVRARDETHAWRLRLERENARIVPLQARRIELQRALAPFATSRVLLRSAFLRLRPDATGRVPAPTAAQALVALAPAHMQVTDAAAVLAALETQRIVGKPAQDETLAFADFAAAFEQLYQQ